MIIVEDSAIIKRQNVKKIYIPYILYTKDRFTSHQMIKHCNLDGLDHIFK